MGFSDFSKNYMLEQLRQNRITHISLHTADPGTTGANEVTGGEYARIAVVAADFDSANGGAVQLNNDKLFSGPAGTSVPFCGFWNDTDFVAGGAAADSEGATESFNSDGLIRLKTGTEINLNA